MKLNLSIELDKIKAHEYLARLTELGSRIDLKKIIKKQSDPQRRYFHQMCAYYAIEHDAGFTAEEAKIVIKDECGCWTEKNGRRFPRSTADLNKEEYGKMIDRMLVYAATEGIKLYTPEEYRDNQYAVDNLIKNNSQWIDGAI